MNITLTSGATISATGPVAGSAQSTASVSGEYTLWLEVVSLTATRLRLGIEDSPDGTTWTPLEVWVINGPTNAMQAQHGRPAGLKANSARINVYEIVGGNALVNSWISVP